MGFGIRRINQFEQNNTLGVVIVTLVYVRLHHITQSLIIFDI